MRADLLKRGIPASRCEVIRNGVDVQLFASNGADCSPNELVDALKREGNIVGVYLGTISAYHGVDCMLDLLEKLQSESRIKIVFAAGGSARADLEREVAARGFSNAVFLPLRSARRAAGHLGRGFLLGVRKVRSLFALAPVF